jgi:predicted RNA methylase
MKAKGTTKSGGQKHSLDKFYTKPEIAHELLQNLNLQSFTEIIEPSAGSGAFANLITDCIAYDLEPEAEGIIQADWFTVSRSKDEGSKILVVGNPPFGQQNSLAVSFINHAAQFADTIAFVLPLSFMKVGVQKRLNKNLHLVKHVILPKNSFTLHGAGMNIPCVFQIWEYDSQQTRTDKEIKPIEGFTFVKKSDNPDLYIQRVGGRAGMAGEDWQGRSEQSNYFIKLDSALFDKAEMIAMVNKLLFEERNLSVGPRSLSKQELLSSLATAL